MKRRWNLGLIVCFLPLEEKKVFSFQSFDDEAFLTTDYANLTDYWDVLPGLMGTVEFSTTDRTNFTNEETGGR